MAAPKFVPAGRPHELDVKVGTTRLKTARVSHNGFFAATTRPNEVGQVVPLRIYLEPPVDEPDKPKVPKLGGPKVQAPREKVIEALGLVRGIIPKDEQTAEQPAGMEIEFYRIGDRDLERWYDLAGVRPRSGSHPVPTGVHRPPTGLNRPPRGVNRPPTGLNRPPSGLNRPAAGPGATTGGHRPYSGSEAATTGQTRPVSGSFRAPPGGTYRTPSGAYAPVGPGLPTNMRAESSAPGAPMPYGAKPDVVLEFEVKLRTERHLHRWINRELAQGSVFVATPDRVPLNTLMKVVIVHPRSLERFGILGRVDRVEYGVGEIPPGLHIAFDELREGELRMIQTFAISGQLP
jgi:hypothetical protein